MNGWAGSFLRKLDILDSAVLCFDSWASSCLFYFKWPHNADSP